MNMGLGLYQEQTLKLVMTPELRQAITILQYSAVDLISYLQDQANENPVFDL
ncbi:RNA polymerase sigma-54 factor, partial [Mesorhizobium sp. M00.F.Ca.ET.186.01.1.1]